MAVLNIRRRSALEPSLVLAPERYDTRRALESTRDSVLLSAIASLVLKTLDPEGGMDRDTRCVVLDTSDAREGMIVGGHGPLSPLSLGSSKKVFGPGDVLISRLRPYLRQVAWVDDGFVRAHRGSALVCSTEFHVLTSVDGESVAFLVPWLLSPGVQKALEMAQEGGHHPRVTRESLLGLRVPVQVLRRRTELSACVIAIADGFRGAVSSMEALIGGVVKPPPMRMNTLFQSATDAE